MADLNNMSIKLELKIQRENFAGNNLCANTHGAFTKTMYQAKKKISKLQKGKSMQVITQLKIHKTKIVPPPTPGIFPHQNKNP